MFPRFFGILTPIHTGYWPVPFSSDEALQIGGLFHQGQFPCCSGYGTKRVQTIFQISIWKVFLLKYIYNDLRKKLETSVDARLQVNVISRSLWKQVSSALAHRRKYNQEAYQRILPYANFETSEKCLLGYHRGIY